MIHRIKERARWLLAMTLGIVVVLWALALVIPLFVMRLVVLTISNTWTAIGEGTFLSSIREGMKDIYNGRYE